MEIERLSIAVTNRCRKACWFCYSASTPAGATRWTSDELVAFLIDCAAHGTKAVSFGGGEPLEYPGIFEVLERLRDVLFRSMTTSGLDLDEAMLARLERARPDKVHLSIHFPGDVERVVAQVHALTSRGIRSGVNLLVSRSQLESAAESARRLRDAGIGNDRIIYLPMRIQDTPAPSDVARVAGQAHFQSMSCLTRCAPSPRFTAIDWDKTVGWCSYTRSRRPLEPLTHAGLVRALDGLPLEFCGGTDDGWVRLSRRALDG